MLPGVAYVSLPYPVVIPWYCRVVAVEVPQIILPCSFIIVKIKNDFPTRLSLLNVVPTEEALVSVVNVVVVREPIVECFSAQSLTVSLSVQPNPI